MRNGNGGNKSSKWIVETRKEENDFALFFNPMNPKIIQSISGYTANMIMFFLV